MKNDLKHINRGFIMILFSSSFVLSLSLLHYIKNLDEYKNLLLVSTIGYFLAFIFKNISTKIVIAKIKNKEEEVK